MAKELSSRIASVLLIFLFLGPDVLASTRALNSGIWKDISPTEQHNSVRLPLQRTAAVHPTPTPANPNKAGLRKPAQAAPAMGITFFANAVSGYLGQHPLDPTNMPDDDIFEIRIEEEPGNYAYAYMQYSIRGHVSGNSFGKSLNGNPAYVTAVPIAAETWEQHTVAIDKRELYKGLNTVRFAMHYVHKSPVEIKDVQLSLTQQPIPTAVAEGVEGMELAVTSDFAVVGEEAEVYRAYVLDARNMPAIPNHITNVTKGSRGFALRGSAEKSVRVSIAVDQKKCGSRGNSLQDVRLFYFDAESHRWMQQMPAHFDMAAGAVEGEAPGNSQYFAGMIKSPEMPEASAYMPTAISDLEAANPAAGMTIIQPPGVSQTGEASISYPLSLPAGRQGMTPQLSINYSSDGGTGWLGNGWSMPIQQISVDNRWGVPTFPAGEQEESYVMDGQALYMEGGLRPNRGAIDPGDDLLEPIARSSSMSMRFFQRSMNGYKVIERYGNSPSTYVWTVTMADQSKYYYGTRDGTTVNDSCIIKNNLGIARWFLAKVEDKWGNTINYRYHSTFESTPSQVILSNGKYAQLLKIEYTGHGSNHGDYSVEFESTKDRPDATLNLKMGIKELDYLQLDRILVKYQTNTVKEYRFNYGTGAFHKTKLNSIEEWRSGQKFYEHSFTYYEPGLTYSAGDTIAVAHFDNDLYNGAAEELVEAISSLAGVYDASPINTTTTLGCSFGGSAGLGVAPYPEVADSKSKNFTFSGLLNGSWSDSKDKTSLMDMNGDGLPDLVYKKSKGLLFYPMEKTGESYTLGKYRRIHGRDRLTFSESTSMGYGFDFALPLKLYYFGMNWNKSWSETSTYTLDYNSDGFMDIVEHEDGKDYISFGRLDSKGEVWFEPTSKNTYNPVIKYSEVTPETAVPDDLKDFEIVRIWTAPFNGVVNVGGSAAMINGLDGPVQVGIQHNGTFISSFATVDKNNSASPSATGVSVNAGEHIMFRVRSGDDGQKDFVQWDPTVKYTSGPSYSYDANGYDYTNNSYHDGFLVSGADAVSFMGNQSIKVSWTSLSAATLTDDLLFKIKINAYDTTGAEVLSEEYVQSVVSGGSVSTSLSDFKDASNNNASFLSSLYTFNSLDSTDLATIAFEVWSTSNVKWQDVSWRPVVEIGTEPCEQADKKVYPIVDFSTYNRVEQLCEPLYNSEYFDCEESFLIWPLLDFSTYDLEDAFDEDTWMQASPAQEKKSYFVVKTPDELLYKLVLVLRSDGTYGLYEAAADGSYDAQAPFTEPEPALAPGCSMQEEAEVFYGFYSEDSLVGGFITQHIELVEYYAVASGVATHEGETEDFENFFKFINGLQDQSLHWGQFAWSFPSATPSSTPIPPEELKLPAGAVAVDPNNDFSDESVPSTAQMEALATSMNPNTQKFFVLNATRGENNRNQLRSYIQAKVNPSDYVSLDRWSLIGSHMATYGGINGIAPGKLGEKEQRAPTNNRPNNVSETAYEAFGITQKSESFSLAITDGISFPLGEEGSDGGVSLVKSETVAASQYKSQTQSQMMDLNGDGYADLIDAANGFKVKYTHPSGGHKPNVSIANVDLGESTTTNSGASASGTFINQDPRFNKQGDDQGTLGGSAGANFGHNNPTHELMDVNGDGLPDYVDYASSIMTVKLGNGRGFLGVTAIEAPGGGIPTSKTLNKSYSLGANMGIPGGDQSALQKAKTANDQLSKGGMSFSVGLGVNNAGSDMEKAFIDLNGDGLSDRVEYNGTTLNILINRGVDFQTCASGDCGSSAIDELGRTGNVGLSGSAAGTVAFPGFLFLGAQLKISININGSVNYAVNRVLSAFRDINGDGIADFVEQDADGNMVVHYAQLDKLNLLKSVTNPLGGSFTLDYERVGNKFGSYPHVIKTHKTQPNERMLWDMAQSKWVMSRLVLYDGYEVENGSSQDIDGVDSVAYAFRYDGGIHSRRDKEFLGFTRTQTLEPSATYWFIQPTGQCDLKYTYLSQVNDYFRPTANTTAEMKKAAFMKGLPKRTYKFFHEIEFDDSSCVRLENVIPRNIQQNEYEFRMVETTPGTYFGQVKQTGPDTWETATWSSLPETATIFPALIATTTINIPDTADLTKTHLVKYDLKYDQYFNVTEYSSGAFEGEPTITEVVVASMPRQYIDYTEREWEWGDLYSGTMDPFDKSYPYFSGRPDSAFMAGITLLDSTYDAATKRRYVRFQNNSPSWIGWFTIYELKYYIVPGPDSSYSADTVYVPRWRTAYGACPPPAYDTEHFYTQHRKVVNDTVELVEDHYTASYYGDIIAEMEYYPPATSNGATQTKQSNMLKKHTITLGAEVKRLATVEALQGGLAPNKIRQYLTATTAGAGANDYAEVNISYSSKGNVTQVLAPKNHKGDSLRTNFYYDTEVEQYVVGIGNSYGDSTCMLYDYATGNIRRTVDINGHATQYVYDDFYRPMEIWAPRELANTTDGPTIRYAYYPFGYTVSGEAPLEERIPVAVTQHNINTDNSAGTEPSAISDSWQTVPTSATMYYPLRTATFTDGLQRVIQVKKDASSNDGSSNYSTAYHISGMPKYDLKGRPEQTSIDWSVSTAGPTPPDIEVLDLGAPVDFAEKNHYDDLNRIFRKETPTATTDYTYKWQSGEAEDNAGSTIEAFCVQTEQQFDSKIAVSRSYSNALGQQIAVVAESSSTPAITLFRYNYLNELQRVEDPIGQVTTYTYDRFGRTTEEVHPDRGTSAFTYDLANNLIKLVTPGTGVNGIEMEYEFNRLIKKTMPASGSGEVNNITYTYGSLSDNFNTAGRVKQIRQGNNFALSFYRYDELGNTVYEQKRLQVPNAGLRIYQTYFEYGSFGRIKNMQYPDGEELEYTYNLTGDLTKMEVDVGLLTQQPIVSNILYNGRGKMAEILYGNGTRSTFGYSPEAQLLTNVKLRENGSGTDNLLNKTISYDAVGHVESIENTAAGANGLGGAYEMTYAYDKLNRLLEVESGSGFKMGTGSAVAYEVDMEYNLAGGITKKTEKIGSSTASIWTYVYNGTKTHQLSNLLYSTSANPTPLVDQGVYTYNSSGSLERVDPTGGSQLVEEGYCWNEEQRLSGAMVKSNYSHYLYDHNGERLMKSSLDYHVAGVDGQTSNGYYSLNPYTVYANAYFVAQPYADDVIGSRHYYMGAQRVSTAVINYPFVLLEDDLNDYGGGPEPEEPVQGSVTDLNNTLDCLGLVEDTDYKMEVLLQPAGAENRMEESEYLTMSAACEEPGAPDDCYCAIDPYWAVENRDEEDCTTLEMRYWYHPDYLGSVEYVTDLNGEAYQYFFRSPWGKEVVAQKAQGTFSSMYKFNGKEQDEETGNYYYGARYYTAELGIWLSVDKLAHEYPNLSPYAFVANNPLSFIDPDGNKILIVSTGNSASNPNEAMKRMVEDAFGGKVTVGAEMTNSDYGFNWAMTISLNEGEVLSESEMAIFNSIQQKTESSDRIEVSVFEGRDLGQTDSYTLNAIFPENVKDQKDGTDGITKLTSIDHFFDEQFSKQILNPGENNYPKDHKYALNQGKEKFGYTWGSNYAPEGANYSQVDVFDKEGNYSHTHRETLTDSGVQVETFIKP